MKKQSKVDDLDLRRTTQYSINDFDYSLPKELIAQNPAESRECSRMLVVDRTTGEIKDRLFSDVLDYIKPNDALVLNNTKVLRARLYGRKKDTGGKVELLLLKKVDEKQNVWESLVSPSLKDGQSILLGKSEVTYIGKDKKGSPLIQFKGNTAEVIMDECGQMPLPPYIKRDEFKEDKSRYQTVYAKKEGSVAAPTAGLHFTDQILSQLKKKKVLTCEVTLHVGLGTFKPVHDIQTHQMHSEFFSLSEEAMEVLNGAINDGRRVWAAGTTSVRVLETCVLNKKVISGSGDTDLFIIPPFQFEVVGGLLTNFHLPKSTLLMLVSAFLGFNLTKKVYQHAIKNKYRFYSYGDAMLVI